MRTKYNKFLIVFCTVLFAAVIAAVFIWGRSTSEEEMSFASSAALSALFAVILFPTLPITALAEIICPMLKNGGTLEKIAFLADVSGTVLVSGMFLLMTLHGGDNIIPYALVISGINILICIIFVIKIKTENLPQE